MTDLEAFTDMVNRHDLTYQHSDDHRCWIAGEAAYKAIREAAKKLPPADVERIWNAKCDQTLIAPYNAQFYWRD